MDPRVYDREGSWTGSLTYGDKTFDTESLSVYNNHYGRNHVGTVIITNEVRGSEGIILNVQINHLTTRKHIFINE